MYYKKGFKYQLVEDFYYKLSFNTKETVELPFLYLNNNKLVIHKGYSWDGAPFPVWDSKNTTVGSLVHYSLYQLLCMDLISIEFQDAIDKELKKICIKKGMNKFIAYIYLIIHKLIGSTALPKNVKKVIKI